MSLVDKIFGAPVAGGAGRRRCGRRLLDPKAKAKGASTVVLRYSQPWPGGTSGEWTYSLTLIVQ